MSGRDPRGGYPSSDKPLTKLPKAPGQSPAADPGLRDLMAEALLVLRREHGVPVPIPTALDVLLPVVAAYVEQQARTRAADELDAAADEGERIKRIPQWGKLLRARATALRGQA